MPNILTDTFPKTLQVSGEEYAIRWDHRECLRIMVELEKGDLAPYEQCLYLVQALYEDIPEDTNEAVVQALWFIHGGRSVEEAHGRADSRRTFSYDKDAEMIYSAFSTRHGIDLSETTLHWWRFRALFTDLVDTSFSEMCSLRRRYYDGDCNEKELEAIAEMGDCFHLDDVEELTWDEQESMAAFEAAEAAGVNG